MTMQFLASIRRNQRQWMVVVTIMAIFAFLFDDVRGGNRISPTSVALVFGVLCAGAMSVVGYSRGHATMYGLVGFAVGASAAWIGTSYSTPRAPVKTAFGAISNEQISRMQRDRMQGNQFLAALVKKVDEGMQAPSFGDASLASMVNYSVLRHEAQRLGVAISDEAVTNFIQEITQKKVTEPIFVEALRETGVGEGQVLDIIRKELEVNLIRRLLYPPANSQQYLGRTLISSPLQLWDTFRKLNIREELTAVPVPVSEFRDQVPEPSETELREYFDKRKGIPGDDRGNPGFLEPPKVKLGYFIADDLESHEKGIPGASDQEIVDYYLSHKEEFRVFDFPEPDDSKLPDLKGPSKSDNPADATAPANSQQELSDGPATTKEKPDSEKPAPDKPAPEQKSEEKKDAVPEKKDDSGAGAEQPKSESNCGDEAEKKDSAKDEEAKPDQNQDADNSAAKAEEGKGDAKQVEDKKDEAKDDGAPPAPALPKEGEAPVKSGDPVLHPPFSPMMNFGAKTPVRYRELNDELKLEIQEKILREKAFAKMGDAAHNALTFMIDLNMKYLSAEKAEKSSLTATFAEKCQEYAKKHGLEYRETKELSRSELESSLDERIGSATESVSDGARRNLRRVAEIAFETAQTESGYRLGLYAPQRADTLTARYAYWKTADIPSRIPDLSNKETRQLVVDSWKYEKARELAQKRSLEIAELAKKQPENIPEALSGQTITGSKDSPPLTVRENPKFSWLRISQSIPTMGIGFPMESHLDQIDQAGPEFFKLIFDQLSDGEIGVGLNRPRTTFYVVRVHNRDGSGEDGPHQMEELRQTFLKTRFTSLFPTPYDFQAMQVQRELDGSWGLSFNQRFGINPNDRLMSSRESD